MSWYDDDVRNIKVLNSGTDITGKMLVGTLTIENILCDGQLAFGACNSARAQITTIEDLSLTGSTLTIQFGNNTDGYTNLGVFKVTYSSTKENSTEVTLTMYDVVKNFDTDISEWYNGLSFPMTLAAFRNALCSHIGVTQETVTLVNDSMTVYETINPSKLNGMDMLRYIGEINGVFPHATSTGTLEWVSLGTTLNTIPLSASQGAKAYVHKTYNTAAISKLCIRSEDGDVGVTVGSGANCYYVTANVLVYGLDSTDLTSIATNLYNKIQGITYNPSELTMKANPDIPMGALVSFNTNRFYVLKRTTKGLLFDTIKADGNRYLKESTSVKTELEQLRGKSNVLTQTIEQTQSTIADVEAGLSTQITQTANSLQVQINDIYSELDGDIRLYYTTETPTLLNYPAWDFTYNIPCNDTVQLADDLAFEYNDTYYKQNLRSIAYDETNNLTYRFIKYEGQWIWDEVANTETSLILSRLSQVEATAESVSIEVQEVRADLTSDYYTIVQTQSAITAASNSILASVSGTYATQSTTASIQLSVQTLQNDKLDTSDLVSTINAQANVITITSNYFTLTADGHITATGGTIGGFTIGSTSIYNGMTSLTDTSNNGIWLGTDGIALGAGAFKVTSAGALTTSNITAIGGSVGGFTITSSSIYNGMTSFADTDHSGVYIGTDGIALGGGEFKVTDGGALTAMSGQIGGFTIDDTDLRYGELTSTSSGAIGLSNYGFTRIIGGTSRSSLMLAIGANFGVDSSGVLYANGGVFSGTITSTSGTIGGFTIGSSSISASGVTISTSGITLGSAFSVTNAGVLTATSGYIAGLTISSNGLSTSYEYTGNTYTFNLHAGHRALYTGYAWALYNGSTPIAYLNSLGTVKSVAGVIDNTLTVGSSISAGAGITQKQNGHTTYVVGSRSYDMELLFNGNFIQVYINGTLAGRINLST